MGMQLLLHLAVRVYTPIVGILGVFLLGIIWDLTARYLGLISYLSSSTGDVNLFSTVFISQMTIALACISEWKKLNDNQKKGAYFIMLGIAFYIAFINNPTIAHRMRELSLLGLLPLLFLNNRKLTYPMLICYIFSIYITGYMLFMTWSELITTLAIF